MTEFKQTKKFFKKLGIRFSETLNWENSRKRERGKLPLHTHTLAVGGGILHYDVPTGRYVGTECDETGWVTLKGEKDEPQAQRE